MGFLEDATFRPTARRRADYRIVICSTELSDVESYSEPAILWRLRHPKGDRARATLIPGSPESTLVFFVNDRLDRGENFAEWAQAMARAEAVRQELLEQGWKIEG